MAQHALQAAELVTVCTAPCRRCTHSLLQLSHFTEGSLQALHKSGLQPYWACPESRAQN